VTTKGERLRKEQRQDRDRQTKRRAKMKAQGIPETHAVHRAMAEAMSFTCAKHFRARTASAEVKAFLNKWATVAAQILVARGNTFDHSAAAIHGQVSPRSDHLYTTGLPPLSPAKQRDDI
jgi:hypothetical protein